MRGAALLGTVFVFAAGCAGESEGSEAAVTPRSWGDRCREICTRGEDACPGLSGYPECVERCDDMQVLVSVEHHCWSEANRWLNCALVTEHPCKIDDYSLGLLPPACETERQSYWACYDRVCLQYADPSYCPHR
jgi:hypothetical protein